MPCLTPLLFLPTPSLNWVLSDSAETEFPNWAFDIKLNIMYDQWLWVNLFVVFFIIISSKSQIFHVFISKWGVQIFCTHTQVPYQTAEFFVAEFEWMETIYRLYIMRFWTLFQSWNLSSFGYDSLSNVLHILFWLTLPTRAIRQGNILFTALEPMFQDLCAMTALRTIKDFFLRKLGSSFSFEYTRK